MAYQVIIKPKAEKELAKIPGKDKERILFGIVSLKSDPYIGKKLQGKYINYYSLRVWPYRIIYRILKKEFLVIIILIGQRQGMYH
jgi:mRNA interferase RelE/StbE